MTSEPRPSWLSRWDLWPLLSALAIAAALPSLMRGLPDPMPTHFDGQGHPNGWTPQAAYPWICFGLPVFVWLLLLVTGRAFIGTEQDPDGRKSAAMAPLRGLIATGILLLGGAVPLIPRFGLGVMGWAVGLLLGLVLLGIVLMARQLKAEWPSDGHPDLYRWGLFYANADDPRIWVPKRLGLGWTLNFAHGMSWFVLTLLTLPPVILVGLVMTRR